MNSTYTIKDWMTALEISRQSSTIVQLQAETTKLRDFILMAKIQCNFRLNEALGETK